MNNCKECKTDNEWINENRKLQYAFDSYKDSEKDVKASMRAALVTMNTENGKLRQKSKAWFVTSLILFAVICSKFF